MTWAGQGLSFLFPHDGAGARSQDLPRLVTHNRRAGLYLSLSLHTVCVESPWQSLSKEQPPPTWNSLTWGGAGFQLVLLGTFFFAWPRSMALHLERGIERSLPGGQAFTVFT